MSAPATPTVRTPEYGIPHLPVSLFAAVMGLGGTALAWRRADHVWGLAQWPSLVFVALAVTVFAVVGTAYIIKGLRWPHTVQAEFRHPIRMAFVPTITIALLVLATALQDLARPVAVVLWWIGAVGHLAATVWALSSWTVREDIGVGHITPAWFIPVVGNIVTPLAAPTIGSVEFAWFAFGVGMIFWVALLPIILYRIVLHETPFPPKLRPTYAIFIAPPAVAMLSWQSLTGRLDDPMGRVLYAAVVILAVLVAAQWPRLRTVPFALPYWAYTFPLAAGATAAIAVAGALPGVVYDIVAIVLLTVSTLVSLGVLARTLLAHSRRQVLVPEK
ncbi:MAG TPA: C4-dicarboxylate ABC transporter [Intrasporangiaceae bacterium]|nr:C4-dicarboxylate ABC transporter [Intrasporangiaceae bacterium]